MNCHHCARPLAGQLDTYGDVGAEVCEACWWAESDDGADLLELELLETIRLATQEVEDIEALMRLDDKAYRDYWDEREFFLAELRSAYRLLDEHRQRRDDRLTRWRESVGAG